MKARTSPANLVPPLQSGTLLLVIATTTPALSAFLADEGPIGLLPLIVTPRTPYPSPSKAAYIRHIASIARVAIQFVVSEKPTKSQERMLKNNF